MKNNIRCFCAARKRSKGKGLIIIELFAAMLAESEDETMRNFLITLIILLVLLGIVFVFLILHSPLGENSRIEKAIQGGCLFIAMIAAVVALLATYPKKKYVKIEIQPFIDESVKNWKTSIKKELLPAHLQKFYEDSGNSIEFYKVHFKIRNTSGFELKNPVFTFTLPNEKQHPKRTEAKEYTYDDLTFHSNIFNSQKDFKMLDMADTKIISNSCLPYLNQGDEITIWFKLVFGNNELFNVSIRINCENAYGATKEVQVEPKKLLNLS